MILNGKKMALDFALGSDEHSFKANLFNYIQDQHIITYPKPQEYISLCLTTYQETREKLLSQVDLTRPGRMEETYTYDPIRKHIDLQLTWIYL